MEDLDIGRNTGQVKTTIEFGKNYERLKKLKSKFKDSFDDISWTKSKCKEKGIEY